MCLQNLPMQKDRKIKTDKKKRNPFDSYKFQEILNVVVLRLVF